MKNNPRTVAFFSYPTPHGVQTIEIIYQNRDMSDMNTDRIIEALAQALANITDTSIKITSPHTLIRFFVGPDSSAE